MEVEQWLMDGLVEAVATIVVHRLSAMPDTASVAANAARNTVKTGPKPGEKYSME